jgi:NTP pyrophosphatase (non-canonical NTP hydrolase)
MRSNNSSTTITEEQYQAEILRTYAGPDDLPNKLTLAALGMSGEAGEVADLVKKHLFQGHPLDRQQLLDELGDILWYYMLLCQAQGYTLTEIMACNIEKLRRRYPDGFDPARSIHREDD